MKVTHSRAGRALLWLIVCLWWTTAHAQKTGGTAAPAMASPAPTMAPTVPLTDIASQSQAATSRLGTFEAAGSADQTVAARQGLPDLSAQINLWLTNSSKALAQRPSLDALRDLETGGRKLQDSLKDQSALLNERARTLDEQTKEVLNDGTLWTATEQEARSAGAPPETLNLCQGVLAAAQRATNRLKENRTNLLELQSQLSPLAAKLDNGLETVRQATSAALKTLFVRDSAPLWARQSAPDLGTASGAMEPPSEQWVAALAYVREHPDPFVLHGAIFLALLGLLLWLKHGLRKWTEEEPDLQRAAPILDVPIATAIALSFVVKGNIYADAPAAFKALLGAMLLWPMIILLRRLLDHRLHPALYFLILFYFVGQVRTTLAALILLNRWIFCAELMVAAVVFWWVTTTGAGPAESGAGAVLGKFPRRLCRLAILLLVAALLADAAGYVRLGTTVGTAVLRSSYAAVFLYALVRVLAGLLLIGLRVPPLSISHIARVHHMTVHQRIFRTLRLLAFAGWFWLTLGFFELQTLAADWTDKALQYKLPTGTLTLTVGHLLGFVVAVWGSVLVARLIRFFLEEEVFERIHLAPGLPYAISSMLNYLVLCVGFLIALGWLGVGFDQITILAGAFSVGLGFGLQNIINNFVSGIILLFERPVKVGDVIQIGDAIGEVRRIGIRASVIGTRDGSDIIVPNGNLISNQFTNWTYSNRQRSVEIPLSIAGAADPNHVLTLLKDAAAAHVATKDQPAPEAYITALTATGISFVVRAWINHYEDWVQTRSELSVALVEALTREDIKLA